MAEFIERAKFTCALGGALTTIAGLPRVIPIVHAAGGCAGALSGTYSNAAGYRGGGYCGGTMIPTTNIAESNVVFGGEDRLEEQIEHTLYAMDGDLYFVVTGCQVEIIGDDAVAVARKFRDRNVVGASTPGFSGNTFKGYDAVIGALIESVVEQTDEKEEKTVNILGIVPGHDVFYRGNVEEIKRLLALIGVKANTFFAAGESVDGIRKYGRAALTVVLSGQAGVESAKKFEELHNIPYISAEVPIGPTGTEVFLRAVGAKLGVRPELIESVLEAENKLYYSYLERIVDIYSDTDFQRYAVVIADSYYAHPLTRFLANDLGWVPHLTAINDIEREDAQLAYAKLFADITSETKPKIVFEANVGLLPEIIRDSWPYNNNQKYYDDFSPAYVIGTGLERGLAEKLGAGFLAVAFPVSNRVVLNKGYAGYRGGLALVEDLISTLVAAR
ncbi:oxidoreductase nitrogenase component 1 [Clostridia bacterium]|nr:oxidoreductase nitrogenase component 1 [Clostridia bacterium]